jgi:hypothetical protein
MYPAGLNKRSNNITEIMLRFYIMVFASYSDSNVPLSTKLVIHRRRKVLNKINTSLMMVTPIKQTGRIMFSLQE